MISYTMTNYVKLYYDKLNYILFRSLMSPKYPVNNTICSMQNTPRDGKIHGPYIYIYIYTYNAYVYIYIYQIIYVYIKLYIYTHFKAWPSTPLLFQLPVF